MKNFYVYMYRDPRPERCRRPIYVGKGKAEYERAEVHWRRGSHNPIMRRILGKLKAANLTPIIEIVAWFDDESDAFSYEKELIAAYGRLDLKTGCLANLTDGGEGKSNPSPATRAKLSALARGRKMSPEHGQKISAAKRGKPLSRGHRAALGPAQKRRWASADEKVRAKLLSTLDFTGRKHSPETIALMKRIHTGKKMPDTEGLRKAAEKKRGVKLSAEHRAKMSEAQYRRWQTPLTPEQRAKRSTSQLRSWAARKAISPAQLALGL